MASRSLQQRARKFLAECFRNDAYDKSEPQARSLPIYSFQVTADIEGAEKERVHALQYTVFVETRKNVYRLPLRRERGYDSRAQEALREPIFFMADSSDELVIEAINLEGLEERCVAVATVPLRNKAGPIIVQFRRGTASMKLISQQSAPDPGDVLFSLKADIVSLTQANLRTHMSGLLPAYTCIPKSVFDPRDVIPLFKVKLRDLAVHYAKSHPEGVFSTRVLIHNGYRELEVFDDAKALVPKMGSSVPIQSWDSSVSFEFPHVPLLPSSHLIVLVYFMANGQKFSTPHSVAAYPLVSPDTRDQNVDLRNLPLMSGPYSSSALPRCLAASGQWFSPKEPLATLSLMLEYYGTPVPAPRSKPADAATPAANPAHAKAAPAATDAKQPAATTTVEPTPAAPGAKPAQPGPDATAPRATTAAAATVDHAPTSGGSTSAAATAVLQQLPAIVEKPVVPSELIEVNNSIHAMLKALAEEVRQIKRAIDTPGAAAAADLQKQADADALKRMEAQGVEIISLATKRISLGHATRAKMMSGCRALVNPFTHQRVDDVNVQLSAQPLDGTAFCMRVDGVTVPRTQTAFPKSLEVHFSFGTEGEVVMGPAGLSLCGEAPDLGQTFALVDSANGARGLAWVERIASTIPREDAELLNKFKRGNGSLYLQVFDAASQFYVASASVPLRSFERSANERHHVLAVDVPLQWDSSVASATSGGVDVAHPLAAGTLGTLHITAGSIGFALPTTATASGNQGASPPPTKLGHRDVNDGSTRVVEVKRLPSSLAHLDQASASMGSQQYASNATKHDEELLKATAVATSDLLRHMPPDRQQLHTLRALHVKKAIEAGTLIHAKTATGNGGSSSSHGATGGADRMELDLRMKLVEKQREELKGSIIAQRLRERLSAHFTVTVARGIPAHVLAEFRNPFHCTMTFHVTFPQSANAPASAVGGGPSAATLDVRRTFGKSFLLAPQETTTIPLIVRHDSPSTGLAAPVACHITTERGELVKVLQVTPTLAKPIVSRTHGIFGDSASYQVRSLYLRSFTAQTLGVERMQMEGLLKLAGNLCTWPICASSSVEVDTTANIDPFAVGCATAWETVKITARIPTSGTETALVHLYANDACEDHVETWALELGLCTTVQAADVFLGETTVLMLPIACEHVFAYNGSCTAAPVKSGSGGEAGPLAAHMVRLAVKPIQPGRQTVLLHAFSAGALMRYCVVFSAAFPIPTHSVQLIVNQDDLALPIFRRLGIDNTTDRQRTFTVSCTYRDVASLSVNSLVDMAPNERRYVTLTLRHLAVGQPYPIFVYVNDESDKTIESFLVHVTVSSGHITAVVGASTVAAVAPPAAAAVPVAA